MNFLIFKYHFRVDFRQFRHPYTLFPYKVSFQIQILIYMLSQDLD